MPDHTDQRRRGAVTVPLVVAVVAAMIAAVMMFASGVGKPSDSAGERAGEALESSDPLLAVIRRQADDPVAMGATDAPVVMINYSEFQCPFCGKFVRDTEPTLIEKYVKEGILRIEWRDFPYLGPESIAAAKAGRAAAAQDEFWAFHDALYANQQPPNSGGLTEDFLAGLAKKVGLDVTQFRKTMNTGDTADAVQRDFAEGQSIGVNGTPAFLINGKPIIGAQPTGVFEEAIERAAAEAQ